MLKLKGVPTTTFSPSVPRFLPSEWFERKGNETYPQSTHILFTIAELFGIDDQRPHTYSYSELRTATEDFSSSNKLGEGGFGPVYKVYLIPLNDPWALFWLSQITLLISNTISKWNCSVSSAYPTVLEFEVISFLASLLECGRLDLNAKSQHQVRIA